MLKVILLLLLAGSGNVAAQSTSVHEYAYQPDQVYVIRTGLGLTTQIELSPNEQVRDYSTGFSSGWEISRRDNLFYVKPKNVDVDTNLMIRTETNSYIIELKVVATDWRTLEQARQSGVQYKVRFSYPPETEFSAKAKQESQDAPPSLSTSLEKSRYYNYNYDYSSRKQSRWLVPVNVYDDGKFTYVRLSDSQSLRTATFPAIFAREREYADDFVVNTSVEGNVLVVHGIYPYLVIRHGKDAVGIRKRKPQ